jgi:FkbM family methyltransferase
MGVKTFKRFVLNTYRAVLWRLPRHWVAEMLRQAGERLGVHSCACDGVLGLYEAKLSDRGVLAYYLIHQTWEPDIHRLLCSLLSPGAGTLIDVGANVGLAMIPLKRTYPQLRVIGIEADTENFGYLCRNLARNGITDATVHQRAAYSCDGELEFELSGHNAGDHRIRQSSGAGRRDSYNESARQVVRVQCSRLDSLISPDTLASPVGMKCDIQGAEVHFFKGADSVLSRTDWLVVEYWPYGITRAGSEPSEFFGLLSRHFNFGGIIDGVEGHMPALLPVNTLEPLVAERLRRENETAHCELLFTKTAVIQ